MLISKYRIMRREEFSSRTLYVLKSADKKGHTFPYYVYHGSAEGREFNRMAEIGSCVFISIKLER